MENKPNNPSAFPCADTVAEHGRYESLQQGMTLRDYFAAKAMQATINQMLSREYSGWDDETIVKYSYEIADKMLKQREL